MNWLIAKVVYPITVPHLSSLSSSEWSRLHGCCLIYTPCANGSEWNRWIQSLRASPILLSIYEPMIGCVFANMASPCAVYCTCPTIAPMCILTKITNMIKPPMIPWYFQVFTECGKPLLLVMFSFNVSLVPQPLTFLHWVYPWSFHSWNYTQHPIEAQNHHTHIPLYRPQLCL